MNNSTAVNALIPHVDQLQWKVFIIFETILLVCAVYVLTALIFYLWKSEVGRRLKGKTSSIKSRSRKLKLVLYGLVLAYTILGVSKFSLAQVLYYAPTTGLLSRCLAIGRAYQLIHVFGTTCLYCFLWLRQNTLYREPSLARLATTALIRFSKLLLFVILVTGASGAVGVFVSSSEHDFAILNGTNACYYVLKTGFNAIVVYISYGLVLLIQGSNLFLFLHILRLHQRELTLHSDCMRSSTSTRIRRLVRNCSIAAAVSTFADLSLVVIDPHIKGRIIQVVTNSLWDIDYATNLACTLFCFTNWRRIVFPWKLLNREDKRRSSSGVSSTS